MTSSASLSPSASTRPPAINALEANPQNPSNPLRTARSLVLLQLLSRLLTFSLNQALLRLASPAVFGTAAIQFDLICSSILFLSREGIRNALLRTKSTEKNKSTSPRNTTTDATTTTNWPDNQDASVSVSERQVQALSIIPLRLGLLISVILGSMYVYSSDEATSSQAYFHVSLGLYVLASLMELSIEPLYIMIHRSNPPKLNVRVQAEGGMAITRSIITVGSLVLLGEKRALLGFALGQVGGAAWLVLRYLKEFGWSVNDLFWSENPTGKEENRYNPQTLSLAIANTGQSLIKHLLTEADRIAVARICPLDGQGGYAVAMNYGSLIARIIFQPLEESLLLHYSSSLSQSSSSKSTSSNVVGLYTLTVRLSVYLTSIILSFVPPLYPAISPILLPRQYQNTTAPAILYLYLISYIPLMSLNGLTESFVTSSATPQQIRKQVRWMIASSGVFAITLLLLTNLDSIVLAPSLKEAFEPKWQGQGWIKIDPTREEALILSSCMAMIVRIIFSFRHAKTYFGSTLKIRRTLPDPKVVIWSGLVTFGLHALARTGRWAGGWKGWIELMGTGGVLGLTTLAFM
uniref:Man(5)GlcNAc(2)-PP-dolichol translocation protein RFT1 n=1 Tax=Kwoniella dejecticola CBS 10117 TaxID=1296121 RepID=A0A1A6A7N8_9TREE|nr:oligosaccharidyl-lipid flippase [Kwoniella dejecticola CBS 10117]OBR86071.1 oligosaccharidyl-lipid flippase [Kwoniella dejecticola CBS 10117]